MSNEAQELAQARLEGQVVALTWMQKHKNDYDQTEENGRIISQYIETHGLEFNADNLEKAFQALTAQGVRFTTAPQIKSLDDVAPAKSYWPPLSSLTDIHRLTAEQARKLTTGPDRAAYEKRINAIQDGYTNQQSASPTPATDTTDALDSLGLPVVDGADASHLPNTVADVKTMPRSAFNLMYHSKRFGPQFRKRIEKIYAIERAN